MQLVILILSRDDAKLGNRTGLPHIKNDFPIINKGQLCLSLIKKDERGIKMSILGFKLPLSSSG